MDALATDFKIGVEQIFWGLLIRQANNCSPFSLDVAVIGHPDLYASFTEPVILNLLTSDLMFLP